MGDQKTEPWQTELEELDPLLASAFANARNFVVNDPFFVQANQAIFGYTEPTHTKPLKKAIRKFKFLRPSDQTMKDGKPDDIIILVMGVTGSGKSTFINDYLGRKEVKASGALKSCTVDVQHYIHSLPLERRIVLVDTPGFNDTYAQESEILRRISAWLASAYVEGMKIAGIVYLHDISLDRMHGSARLSLDMFQQLCGLEFFQKVILAMTHCDIVSADTLEMREAQARRLFWNEIIAGGGETRRILSKPKDIRDIVHFLATMHVTYESTHVLPDALILQKELVDLHKTIPMTEAGKRLRLSLKEYLQKRAELEEDADDAEKQKELLLREAAVKQQIKDLKISLTDRCGSWLTVVLTPSSSRRPKSC